MILILDNAFQIIARMIANGVVRYQWDYFELTHTGGYKCPISRKGSTIVEIRRSSDCLISTVGFPVLVGRHLYIESGLRTQQPFTLKSRGPCVWTPLYLAIFCNTSSASSTRPLASNHSGDSGMLQGDVPPHVYTITRRTFHYTDVIKTTMAFQINSLTVVYSTVYSDADQRKHQSYASLAYVWGIHRDRWIPRTKGQLRGKCFHLMTSSCLGLGFWSSVRILTTFWLSISQYLIGHLSRVNATWSHWS